MRFPTVDTITDCQIETIEGVVIKDCQIPVTTLAAAIDTMTQLPATGPTNLLLSLVGLGFVLIGSSVLFRVLNGG